MLASRDRVLSALIEQVDAPGFQESFLRSIDELVSFDMAMVAIYDKGSLASCQCYQFPSGVAAKALRTYQQKTFRFNPFYQHHLRGIEPGVYLMSSLLQCKSIQRPGEGIRQIIVDPREEIGYVSIGWPSGLKELDFVVRTGRAQTTQIALYRCGNSRFNSQDVGQLSSVRMSLAALFVRAQNASLVSGREGSPASLSEELFVDRRLSAREKEVVRLIIEGSSTDDVAAKLLVSAETIKTIRKRAYLKLGISSKTDLFAKILSLQSFAAGASASHAS